jgi:hypothetical protein
MPEWLRGDILDVRTAVTDWLEYGKSKGVSRKSGISHHVSSSAEILCSTVMRLLYCYNFNFQLEIDVGNVVRREEACAALLIFLPS